MAYHVNKKETQVKINAASAPHWFSQFVPVLSAMAAKRPLVQPGHSSSSITVRFPTDKAYVDPILLRKLFNLCSRHKLGMYFEKRVNGLYLTITDEDVAEAETGVTV